MQDSEQTARVCERSGCFVAGGVLRLFPQGLSCAAGANTKGTKDGCDV
jgi:hypothetical protein